MHRGRGKAIKGTRAIGLILLGAILFLGTSVVLFLNLLMDYTDIAGTIVAVAIPIAVLLLGFFLGFFYGNKSVEEGAIDGTVKRFRKAFDFEHEQRLRLEKGLKQSQVELSSLSDELKTVRAEARQETDRRTKLDKEIADLNEQRAKLEEEVATLRALHAEARRESGQRTELEEELTKLTGRCEELKQNLDKRKERIADLQVELSIAQTEAQQAKAALDDQQSAPKETSTERSIFEVQLDEGTAREVLTSLVALKGVKSAVIADDHGLKIESAGEAELTENLAAVSSRVANYDPQIQGILPLDEISSVSLGDGRGLVVDLSYFELFGMRCALVIARDKKYPYPDLPDKAIAAFTALLTK